MTLPAAEPGRVIQYLQQQLTESNTQLAAARAIIDQLVQAMTEPQAVATPDGEAPSEPEPGLPGDYHEVSPQGLPKDD